MQRFRSIPFIGMGLALIAGILLAPLLSPAGKWLAFGFAGMTALLLFLSRKKLGKIWEIVFLTSLGLTFLFTGAGLREHKEKLPTNEVSNFVGTTTQLQAKTLTEGRSGKYGQRVWVDAISLGDSALPVSGKLVLYVNDTTLPLLPAHQVLTCTARLKPHKDPESGYGKYLMRKGIRAAASGWNLELKEVDKDVGYYLDQSRFALRSSIVEEMSDTAATGLAVAMLLGDKTHLDKSVKEHFATAGISHILAVSGLHVGLIFLLLELIFSFLSGKKQLQVLKGLIVMAILIAYALLTGAGPAVSRAVFMLCLVIIGRMTYRQMHTLNLVAFSAVVQLLWNPLLLFDVGFQLSYSAVIGILLLTPRLSRFFKGKWPLLPKKVLDPLSVTLSAQLFTAPLVIYYFHTFPTYFLISNLVLLPLATLAVWAGFVSLMISFIPFLSDLGFWITEKLLQVLNLASGWISELPGASIQSFSTTEPGIWILLCLLIGFATMLWLPQWLRRRKENSKNVAVSRN